MDTLFINGVAGGCGGLVRTLNFTINGGGLKELIANFDIVKFVYNVGSGAAFGYFFGTDPVGAFETGFFGNYVLSKGLQAGSTTAKKLI